MTRTIPWLVVPLLLSACTGSTQMPHDDAAVSVDGAADAVTPSDVAVDAAPIADSGNGPDGSTPTDGGSPTCDIAPVTFTHSPGTPGALGAQLLDPATYGTAVCNDGTPGYYYFRRGYGGGAHRWVIYLEGGGSCGSSAECAARLAATPGYMSSSRVHNGDGLPMALQGIKSTDATTNPDFYDANYVQLAYCSSDAWSGDVAGDSTTYGTSDVRHWNFRGRAIVDAVMHEVVRLGLASGDEVLLAGSSAGGVGVFVNADRVGAALGTGIRFLALPDAGFMIDYPSYDPTTGTESTAVPTARTSYLQVSAAAWGGGGDASCEATATTAADRLLCRSPYWLGTTDALSTRFFVRQSQYDHIQIAAFIDSSQTTTAANQYRGRWAAHMVSQLTAVVPHHAVYSTNDTQHGVINDDAQWTTLSIGAVTLPGAVGRWYRDPCSHSEHLIAP